MKLLNVYPRYNFSIENAKGVFVFDENNQRYLDLYGGHGVISIGHTHPHYTAAIENQLQHIGFYSNSVKMPLQEQLAALLGNVSGYNEYRLFMCNSGAEANENALKLASFHTGKRKFVSFHNSFHGRTAGALNITDDAQLSAPVNMHNFEVIFIGLNDEEALAEALKQKDIAGVIIEGIQGVGGLEQADLSFFKTLVTSCEASGALLILDEIQSGYGRTGKFFAHQHADIRPHIITIAKGMGNGFPVAGVLSHPDIKAHHGMLGTTFGGNHLACAAAIAVLEVIVSENLIQHAADTGQWLADQLGKIQVSPFTIKGRGLMLGIDLHHPVRTIRDQMLHTYRIFTGNAKNPNVLRILPPLCISKEEINPFINTLNQLLT